MKQNLKLVSRKQLETNIIKYVTTTLSFHLQQKYFKKKPPKNPHLNNRTTTFSNKNKTGKKSQVVHIENENIKLRKRRKKIVLLRNPISYIPMHNLNVTIIQDVMTIPLWGPGKFHYDGCRGQRDRFFRVCVCGV